MYRFIFLLLAGVSIMAIAGGQSPEGEFENSACLECHQQQNPELVAAWQSSAHSMKEDVATCVACHGNSHEKAAARARRDATCIDCHGGKKAPAVHSYTTSKHGILTRLEQKDWDWERPLESANYRAPGCAYCHMHSGNHGVGTVIRAWQPEQAVGADERERVQDIMRAVCQDCHAPRYVTTLFDTGERMLDIARMKVREAAVLMAKARGSYQPATLEDAEKQILEMKARHLKNVYLGIAHQSPDYQWWHGQAALDGDLIRIRGVIDQARRLKLLESPEPAGHIWNARRQRLNKYFSSGRFFTNGDRY
jgi:hypothetical protein